MEHHFKQFHPLILFSYYIGAIAIVLLLLHPIFLVSALVIILLLNYIQDGFRGLKQWRFIIVTTGLFIFILNPLFNERGRHVLFQSEHFRITQEALIYGGITAVSIVCMIALFISYNDTMTPNKIMFLFAKIMPQFAVLLMLTLRFIPLMRVRLEEISLVQRSKGIDLRNGRLVTRLKNGMSYVQTLLTYSLEEAIQTADSMKARGYGNAKRTTYEYYRFKRNDVFVFVVLLVLFASILFGRLQGFGHLIIYPRLESIELVKQEWVLLGSYLVFLGLPLLIELGGNIRWRMLK